MISCKVSVWVNPENVLTSSSSRVVLRVLMRIHLGCRVGASLDPPDCEVFVMALPSMSFRKSSREPKPRLIRALVSSAERRALCRVMLELRPCVAGKAIPFLARNKSWTRRRASVGVSWFSR